MSEIKNETNMIDQNIHKLSEMDNDILHRINNRLKGIYKSIRKKLKKDSSLADLLH